MGSVRRRVCETVRVCVSAASAHNAQRESTEARSASATVSAADAAASALPAPTLYSRRTALYWRALISMQIETTVKN